MVIASRTPEGEPAACPLCGKAVCIEPSIYFADATCPSCGSLLWFVRLGDQNVLVNPTPAARTKGLICVLSDICGIDEHRLADDPAAIDGVALDSVDLVELAMQFEAE